MDELTHGLGGEWMCLMFDRAVMYFGSYIENKLAERDPKTHKPLYTLKGLLSDRPNNSVQAAMRTRHAQKPPWLLESGEK